MLQEGQIRFGCFQNIQCVVRMPGSTNACERDMNFEDQDMLTLIARVRMATITSREPPKTQLSSQVGSYSQITVTFFDSHNLRYASHNINVTEVDYVSEATVGGTSNKKR